RTSGNSAPVVPRRETGQKIESPAIGTRSIESQPERPVLRHTSDPPSRATASGAPLPEMEHTPALTSLPAPTVGLDPSRLERQPVQLEQVWTVPDAQLPRRSRSRAVEDERKGYGA